MNLDNPDTFAEIDREDMLGAMNALPDQLQAAWKLGASVDLPPWENIKAILISGMGGSAIGGDLLSAYVAPTCRVPIIVQRDYGLPAWASGEEILVIASSHSGNTEETLSTFRQSVQQGCRNIAITTNGKLAQEAAEVNAPTVIFEHEGQPRAAVGYSFGILLGLLAELNLIPEPSAEVENAVQAMKAQQKSLKPDSPTAQNPAKRMAGQLVGRWISVLGAEVLAPVARRWKGQMSEVAKAWAQFEHLPEADHNTLAGTENPEDLLTQMMVLFLRAPSYREENRLRADLTRKSFMLQGINTDFIDALGDTRLAHQWTALHFGDYLSYYLAMAYGVDPTPVESIEQFKAEMRQAREG